MQTLIYSRLDVMDGIYLPNCHKAVLLLGLENEVCKIAEHGGWHIAGTQKEQLNLNKCLSGTFLYEENLFELPCYPKDRPNCAEGTSKSEALHFFLFKLFDVLGENTRTSWTLTLILWLGIVYLQLTLCRGEHCLLLNTLGHYRSKMGPLATVFSCTVPSAGAAAYCLVHSYWELIAFGF